MLNIPVDELKEYIDEHYLKITEKYPEYVYLFFEPIPRSKRTGSDIFRAVLRQCSTDNNYLDNKRKLEDFVTTDYKSYYFCRDTNKRYQEGTTILQKCLREYPTENYKLQREVKRAFNVYANRKGALTKKELQTIQKMVCDELPMSDPTFSNIRDVCEHNRALHKMSLEWEYTPEEIKEAIEQEPHKEKQREPQDMSAIYLEESIHRAIMALDRWDDEEIPDYGEHTEEIEALSENMRIPEKKVKVKPVNTHNGVVTVDDLEFLDRY